MNEFTLYYETTEKKYSDTILLCIILLFGYISIAQSMDYCPPDHIMPFMPDLALLYMGGNYESNFSNKNDLEESWNNSNNAPRWQKTTPHSYDYTCGLDTVPFNALTPENTNLKDVHFLDRTAVHFSCDKDKRKFDPSAILANSQNCITIIHSRASRPRYQVVALNKYLISDTIKNMKKCERITRIIFAQKQKYDNVINITNRYQSIVKIYENMQMMPSSVDWPSVRQNWKEFEWEKPYYFFNQPEVLKWLLEEGLISDIDAKDDRGNTALMLAIKNSQDEIAQFLVEHGADIYLSNAQDQGTPLKYAVMNTILGRDQSALIESLLAAAKQKNNPCLQEAFKCAMDNDHVDIMKIFIKHGFDINMKDKNGNSLLRDATLFGKTESVQFLLKHGANNVIPNDHSIPKNGLSIT